MAPGTEGGYALNHKTGVVTSVYDAAMASDVPMVVLAGSQYGTGSSRDWAAKGTYLLGVKAVFATSFERIHRSNLVGMGVLPLTFKEGDDSKSLGLDGTESFDIPVTDDVKALQELTVTAHKMDGSSVDFTVDVRLPTFPTVEHAAHCYLSSSSPFLPFRPPLLVIMGN
jgi:aconitate hydratase